ncbi:hypothetical protein CAOG_02443 [Capsaspora owczarzaki ATCC 30864]|uniref:Uncharacterized protein n=1 Tax=Capsaspora owczarzaki (strain ATCC 30864) TaxID=595528 RepID=A0A0D2X1R8_CAPO3|nr:hypothetical protein CAOG_02443 [Capsaspora owczarzaki ATCC 30864]KJE91284.1 hypothetical protein CAOG_002443 [Capsaspora owczarzaki ATCC 30864]|eukprot:XP_004349193.1 hypothetical protein CAOG_02443 [Capsaspora owczarzaki ATCC 30864]
MRIWVGDETGLLKGLNIERSVVNRYLERDRQRGITHMSFAGVDGTEREDEIAVGLANGTVGILSQLQAAETPILREFLPVPAPVMDGIEPSPANKDEPAGAYTAPGTRAPRPRHYVNSAFSESTALAGVEVFNRSLITCTKEGWAAFRKLDGETTDAPVLHFKAAPHCEKMRLAPASEGRFIATGGNESDLRVWDVTNTAAPVFQAKNLPHDNTELRVPVWITDLNFIPNTSAQQVVVGTAYKEIRLYDARVKRRPTLMITVGEYGVNSLTCSNDGRSVFVGDKAGHISAWDLRNGNAMGRYKGCAGAIRGMQQHATLPLLAVASVDRFVRVYDVSTRVLAHKFYVKQQLSALLFSSEGRIKVNKPNADSDSDERSDNEDDVEDDDEDAQIRANGAELDDFGAKARQQREQAKKGAAKGAAATPAAKAAAAAKEDEEQEEDIWKQLRSTKEQAGKSKSEKAAKPQTATTAAVRGPKRTAAARKTAESDAESDADNADSAHEEAAGGAAVVDVKGNAGARKQPKKARMSK